MLIILIEVATQIMAILAFLCLVPFILIYRIYQYYVKRGITKQAKLEYVEVGRSFPLRKDELSYYYGSLD